MIINKHQTQDNNKKTNQCNKQKKRNKKINNKRNRKRIVGENNSKFNMKYKTMIEK